MVVVVVAVAVAVELCSTGTASNWLWLRHYLDFAQLYAAETQFHRLELELEKGLGSISTTLYKQL